MGNKFGFHIGKMQMSIFCLEVRYQRTENSWFDTFGYLNPKNTKEFFKRNVLYDN